MSIKTGDAHWDDDLSLSEEHRRQIARFCGIEYNQPRAALGRGWARFCRIRHARETGTLDELLRDYKP